MEEREKRGWKEESEERDHVGVKGIPLDARRAATKLDQPDIREDESKNEDERNEDKKRRRKREKREREKKRAKEEMGWDDSEKRPKRAKTKHNFLFFGGGPDSVTVLYNTMAEYG